MLPQYRMIRDFDLYEQQYMEMSRFRAPVFHKEDFLKETQDNELENEKFPGESRSLKGKGLKIQTSFESSFMAQHKLAFGKSLQKLVEKIYPSKNKVQGKSLVDEIFSKEGGNDFSGKKLTSIVMKDGRLFEQEEKKKFLKDLEHEEKLNEFLALITSNKHSGLGLELVFVADLFWQAYIPKQEMGLSESEIQSLVDGLLETEHLNHYLQKLEYLNFSKVGLKPEVGQSEINQELKVFLKKFGVTVMLVIEQYFKNPYSKDEQVAGGYKRGMSFKDISNDEFSDDEDEMIFSYGHKKRNI